jgi:hypothetical protein
LLLHLWLGCDFCESAASLREFTEIGRVGHRFLAIGATSKTSEAAVRPKLDRYRPVAARGKSPAAPDKSCGACRANSGGAGRASQQRGQSWAKDERRDRRREAYPARKHGSR